MRADYDSQGHTLDITLMSTASARHGDSDTHPKAVVHLAGGDRPIGITILNADDELDAPLAAVAAAYDLDLEALTAAGRSALAAPDRQVYLEVADRSAA